MCSSDLYLEVPVTSISMPLPELGAAAVDALIARIEGGPPGDVMVREPMRLIPRESVAPPRELVAPPRESVVLARAVGAHRRGQ